MNAKVIRPEDVKLNITEITLPSVQEIGQAPNELLTGNLQEDEMDMGWWLRSESNEPDYIAFSNDNHKMESKKTDLIHIKYGMTCELNLDYSKPYGKPYEVNVNDTLVTKKRLVRPILKIDNLEQAGINIGDKIQLPKTSSYEPEMTFTVIGKDIALYDNYISKDDEEELAAIIQFEFNKHTHHDKNDYEQSDVKQIVDEWAERNQIEITKFVTLDKLNVEEVTLLSSDEFKAIPKDIYEPVKEDFWLRNKYKYSDTMGLVVNADNHRIDKSNVTEERNMRPVLRISNLEEQGIKPGDKIRHTSNFGIKPEFAVTFTVISKDLALCDYNIGHEVFNKDLADKNTFERSHIKERLDFWAKTAGIHTSEMKLEIDRDYEQFKVNVKAAYMLFSVESLKSSYNFQDIIEFHALIEPMLQVEKDWMEKEGIEQREGFKVLEEKIYEQIGHGDKQDEFVNQIEKTWDEIIKEEVQQEFSNEINNLDTRFSTGKEDNIKEYD